MNEEDILNESCLTCTKYDGMKHWYKGEKFCPHYPEKMSLKNYDIIGGYKCEYYERKHLIIPAYKEGNPNRRPVLVIDLSKFNTVDDIINLIKRFFDDEGNLSIGKNI